MRAEDVASLHTDHWRRNESGWLRYVLPALFAFSLLTFLALVPFPRADGQLIGSDGVGYYVYLPSLVIDGDLDFTNDYAYFAQAFKPPPPTPLGQPGNKYSIGAALLWLPFFLVAHALALIGQAVGMPVAADGRSYLYQAAISIGSICYGAVGMLLAYRCTARLFAAPAALAATALFWLASNAIYYMIIEPSMAHMSALFSVGLLLTIWFERFRGAAPPSLYWAVALGAAGGLVPLVRQQDAIFLLLPLGSLLARAVFAWHAGEQRLAGHWLLHLMIAVACTFLVFTPQLVVWQRLYGTWITSPYTADHDPAFNWLHPQIANVLFSTFHGLFSWHPVMLLATLGLALRWRRDRRLAVALAGLLALNIYIVAAWWAWWQGDSFGGRMFLSAAWIWIVGLAGLIDLLWSRWRYAVLIVGFLLVIWNGLALAQYRFGQVPRSAPLTWQQMTVDRLRLPFSMFERFAR